jgi:hypothetical protein
VVDLNGSVGSNVDLKSIRFGFESRTRQSFFHWILRWLGLQKTYNHLKQIENLLEGIASTGQKLCKTTKTFRLYKNMWNFIWIISNLDTFVSRYSTVAAMLTVMFGDPGSNPSDGFVCLAKRTCLVLKKECCKSSPWTCAIKKYL